MSPSSGLPLQTLRFHAPAARDAAHELRALAGALTAGLAPLDADLAAVRADWTGAHRHAFDAAHAALRRELTSSREDLLRTATRIDDLADAADAELHRRAVARARPRAAGDP